MSQERLATMLTQLKDTSGLMVDLAYSALLYGSEEVADHVLEMEKSVDRLHTEFELAILELRETRPTRGLLGSIRLALAAEELADAAAMMADIVKKGIRAHPVIGMALEKAEETIVVTEITEASSLGHKTVGELGLEDDLGMRIIAVRRGENWTYNPPDSFTLLPRDVIVAQGYSDGREKLLTLADPSHSHQ